MPPRVEVETQIPTRGYHRFYLEFSRIDSTESSSHELIIIASHSARIVAVGIFITRYSQRRFTRLFRSFIVRHPRNCLELGFGFSDDINEISHQKRSQIRRSAVSEATPSTCETTLPGTERFAANDPCGEGNRSYRIVFQAWVVLFLLVICFALLNYLITFIA